MQLPAFLCVQQSDGVRPLCVGALASVDRYWK
eukprot:SAG11_NODE_19700_length_461_cov_0.491713_1_plen_31_part_10